MSLFLYKEDYTQEEHCLILDEVPISNPGTMREVLNIEWPTQVKQKEKTIIKIIMKTWTINQSWT